MPAMTGKSRIEIPLPPRYLRTGGRPIDDEFVAGGIRIARLLYRHGLHDEQRLLDVGCSAGRLPIGLLADTSFSGRYEGFDITPRQIRWAKNHLVPVAPNLHFELLDIRNDRYNPKGTLEPEAVRFPVDSDEIDMACLFSIFTHFYAKDIQHYLHELHRVLRPGGTVVATWFLWDENRYQDAREAEHAMVHRLDDDVLYAHTDDPLHAIAYRISRAREMIQTAGLELIDIELGTWARGPGPEYQDVTVLKRPV